MNNESKVYLVGAGPGDPDLLTVKAVRLLERADAVVYDRLISPEVLAFIPPGVTRVFVGKASGNHSLPQDEINALLVKLARAGYSVVRLKGGDPFMFGRGSEEAAYLARHGVHFEIVPGITAAAAGAAYAGIPLTHRGLAQGVHFLTGHHRADAPLELDGRQLADADTTLAIYMGLANLQRICAEIIRAGRAPDTPAAAIESATTARQRRCVTTLAELPARVQALGFGAPVMFIIGRVVTLAGSLDWFVPATDTAAGESDARHRLQA